MLDSRTTSQDNGFMETEVEVSALAINVTIPKELQWSDTRDGKRFMLNTLNIRILPS